LKANNRFEKVRPIPTIALEADRYVVSERAAAPISTTESSDYGVVTAEERINIFYYHKV